MAFIFTHSVISFLFTHAIIFINIKLQVNHYSSKRQIIMTPLIFISFLVSLAIVDLRYSAIRSHYHSDDAPSPGPGPGPGQMTNPHQTGSGRTPSWLHRLLFKYRPYRYTPPSSPTRDQNSSHQINEEKYSGIWGTYYRTKQRKLMKMEAADAFEIRSTVLFVLGILGGCLAWGLWRVLSWTLCLVWSRI